MKALYKIVCLLIGSAIALQTDAYQAQGTTVIKEACNVQLVLQIALETDSVGDIARMQAILDECFSLSCDLPCLDRSIGKCSIVSKVIVVNWKDLSPADKPKFHHVTMLSGSGVSFVNSLIAPNSGKSSGGSWYRNEYSSKVYCHEAMHLCGLDDHYRDCRADRLALGVDNCKDGDTCTAEQIRKGECPPCKGYEHDVMGNDVTKPFGCNKNIVEIIRFLNNPDFVCSDSCCEHKSKTQTEYKPGKEIGVMLDGGLGYYALRNTVVKDDKLNLLGPNFSLGIYGTYPLCPSFMLMAYTRMNCAGMRDTRTEQQQMYSYVEKYTYRLDQLSIGANVQYSLTHFLRVFAGPETAFILAARSRLKGSTTYNNVTTPFGNDEFTRIEEKKNIQLAINLGAAYIMTIRGMSMNPYFNLHVPLTNSIAYENVRNKYLQMNVGVYLALLSMSRIWH